jgi:GTP pyrophosphokinase
MKSVVSEMASHAAVLDVAAQGFASQDLARDAQVGSALARARAFAEPLIGHESLDAGENVLAHADAVAAILRSIGGSEAMQAASYLVYACDHLNKPQEIITRAFGESYASLAIETTQLVRVQRQARLADASKSISPGAASQTENVRKMLLAFSRDLRVVMLRLASRLQTLRHYAATKLPVSQQIASESLHVFAPLANRLGIWQIKWEMEDLAFRFLEPEVYKSIAKQLDEKRIEREQGIERIRSDIESMLRSKGVRSEVFGRPKHIYSIVKKMRGKGLPFEQVFDVRAFRIIVETVEQCYAALSWVHELYTPITAEFDDYIAKPKANGYQSLHTIVRDAQGRAIEIQIRTKTMHEHAETGVAAHWAYKEAGAKGYAGVSASSTYDAKIAVLRQLLAWERDLSAPTSTSQAGIDTQGIVDDRIYVLTPDAAIVDLPAGATPVDFAYAVHTNLGHRCRGAKIDGVMVPLNTQLSNGQTVEVVSAKEGGPSRDWLNAELGYLASPRAKAKVRAWFNALVAEETVARGREAVEKLLQREGKTALKFDDLASQLGLKNAQALFEVVGKDELSLRAIEQLLRPASDAGVSKDEKADELILLKTSRASEKKTGNQGGVLVVGVDSLLTQLAKCCKPAPPDAIRGFVTRGKGVSIHRAECANVRQMIERDPGREVAVEWGIKHTGHYSVDVRIHASDRAGLLRDITELFSKEKLHVQGVQSQSSKGESYMTLTVEVSDSSAIARVLASVMQVKGVISARRR